MSLSLASDEPPNQGCDPRRLERVTWVVVVDHMPWHPRGTRVTRGLRNAHAARCFDISQPLHAIVLIATQDHGDHPGPVNHRRSREQTIDGRMRNPAPMTTMSRTIFIVNFPGLPLPL